MPRLLSVALLSTLAAQQAAPAPAVAHDAFDRILAAVVRNERVDYLRLRRDHREALQAYIAELAGARPDDLPRPQRLAFLLNLYNAVVLDAVAARLVGGWTPAQDGFRLFQEKLVPLAGRRISLNELENDVIRKQFAEPRIHVALVCAAVSCPPLQPRAFRGEDLEATLEGLMQRFLRDLRRNPVDDGGRKLVLSQIFEWYAPDFGGRDRLPEYVSRYRETAVLGYALQFTPYDWELNLAAPAVGRWAELTAAAGGLARGELVEVLAEEGEVLEIRHPSRDERIRIPAARAAPFPRPAGRR